MQSKWTNVPPMGNHYCLSGCIICMYVCTYMENIKNNQKRGYCNSNGEF